MFSTSWFKAFKTTPMSVFSQIEYKYFGRADIKCAVHLNKSVLSVDCVYL